ncbi:MAG TPA: YidB family protein [Roseomonas sp.]
MGQSGMAGLEGLLSQLSAGRGGANGLDGLLGTLREAGLGEQVDSWVNAGTNQPVTPQAVTQAFGEQRLDGAAQGLGLQGGGVLAGVLAQLLPVLIDRLTPHGQVPATPQDDGGGWGGILGGLLGGGQHGQGGGGLGGGLGGILGGLLGGMQQQGGGAGGGGLGDILGGLLGGMQGGGQQDDGQQAGSQGLPPAPRDDGVPPAAPAAGGDDPFGALLRGMNRGG